MGHYLTPNDYIRAAANGIKSQTLEQRVRVYGWDTEKAVTAPLRQQKDRSYWRVIAEQNGITAEAFYRRINSYGWEIERAATEPMISQADSLHRASLVRRVYSPEWIVAAAENGISAALFRERVRKYDWSYERAATEPRMSPSESGRKGKEVLIKRLKALH